MALEAQATNGTPDKVAELAHDATRAWPPSMEAAGAVDAQNASTAPWKTHTTRFPQLPQPHSSFKRIQKRYKATCSRREGDRK
jgi:hypothetical protein